MTLRVVTNEFLDSITNHGTAVERCSKDALGDNPPIMQAVAGETVYVRASAASTPDSANTVCAYGVVI